MSGNLKLLKTRSGPMMALTTDFYIGFALELYGEYCPDEWAMLRGLIEPEHAI